MIGRSSVGVVVSVGVIDWLGVVVIVSAIFVGVDVDVWLIVGV